MKVKLTVVFSAFALVCWSMASYAQDNEVNEIKTNFDKTKDLGQLLSFVNLLGKTYQCTEYEYIERLQSYRTYSTRITFENKLRNYYGGGTTLDYLEYAEYRRIDQETAAQVPRFGCDGIEWGVAYLEDAPFLHMSNLVSQVGNTNLGPCYSLKFRINGKGKFLAVGVYNKKVIHALKCTAK